MRSSRACPFPLCSRRNKPKDTAWTELLSARGSRLWTLRAQTLSSRITANDENDGAGGSNNNNDRRYLPVEPQRRRAHVVVFSSVEAFVQAEREYGMDKSASSPQPPAERTANEAAQPLTQSVGDEWTRQRRIMKDPVHGPLVNIPALSLEAANAVDLWRLFDKHQQQQHSKKSTKFFRADLKQLVVDSVGEWAVRLFQGQHDAVLHQAFLAYWTAIRQRQRNPKHIQQTRTAYVRALHREPRGGLVQSFAEAGFASPKEAEENVVHAMVAASDATACLVFWTLVNLANQRSVWDQCRKELDASKSGNDRRLETDYKALAELKQRATQGQPINKELVAQLSCLGRSLVETLRVYPPVWTLPRAASWKESRAISAKLDVPTINGALHPNDWNPMRQEQKHIASFGVGKRSCPAGTAALLAARFLLHEYARLLGSIEEVTPGRAVQRAYLGPTLAAEGPEWFRFSYAD